MKKKKGLLNILGAAVVIGYTLFMLLPLYLLLITSLKPEAEVLLNPIALPHHVRLQNFSDALSMAGLLRVSLNSILTTGTTLMLVVIFNTLIAYGLHKLRGKKIGTALYSVFVIAMAIPSTGIVNMLILYRNLHLTNTLGLILNQSLASLPFAIFIMVGYMRSLPKDIEEAAYIDGCTELQNLMHIIVPSIKPILTTVVILNMVSSWNNLIGPLLLLRNKAWYTIPVAIFSFRGSYHINYPLMFAVVLITSIPLVVLFFWQQNNFVEGLAGGIKG